MLHRVVLWIPPLRSVQSRSQSGSKPIVAASTCMSPTRIMLLPPAHNRIRTTLASSGRRRATSRTIGDMIRMARFDEVTTPKQSATVVERMSPMRFRLVHLCAAACYCVRIHYCPPLRRVQVVVQDHDAHRPKERVRNTRPDGQACGGTTTKKHVQIRNTCDTTLKRDKSPKNHQELPPPLGKALGLNGEVSRSATTVH
jgi:hypothetical protein